jgi:hypothetical protein
MRIVIGKKYEVTTDTVRLLPLALEPVLKVTFQERLSDWGMSVALSLFNHTLSYQLINLLI